MTEAASTWCCRSDSQLLLQSLPQADDRSGFRIIIPVNPLGAHLLCCEAGLVQIGAETRYPQATQPTTMASALTFAVSRLFF